MEAEKPYTERFIMGQAMLDRLQRWRRGEEGPPLKLELFLTHRCNMGCIHCTNSASTKSEELRQLELDSKTWLRVVREGLDLGVRRWRIVGGGEPLLRKDLVMEISRLIKKHPTENHLEIHSNGTLFSSHVIQEIVRLGVDLTVVSLDGADEGTHDTIRSTKGSFKRIKRCLDLFRDAKRKQGVTLPSIKLNTIVCNLNYRQLPGMVNLGHSLGIDGLAFFPVLIYEETRNSSHLIGLDAEARAALKHMIPKAKKSAIEHGLQIDLSPLEDEIYKPQIAVEGAPPRSRPEQTIRPHRAQPRKLLRVLESMLPGSRRRRFMKQRCYEPWYVMVIDPEGNVAPCCPAGMGDKSTNVKNMDLKEAWTSRYFQMVRKYVLEDMPLDICEVCPIKYSGYVRDIRHALENNG